jgi:hypothetical protein
VSPTPPRGQQSLRELIALARERLGPAASALKTRAELERALFSGDAPASPTDPTPVAVVVRDFFVKQS